MLGTITAQEVVRTLWVVLAYQWGNAQLLSSYFHTLTFLIKRTEGEQVSLSKLRSPHTYGTIFGGGAKPYTVLLSEA